MANKWTFSQKVSLTNNENLQKLVQFYVWETPVPNTSARGVSFSDLGWSKGDFNTLHASMRKSSGFPNKKWIDAPAKEIEERLKELERLDSFNCSFEFAVHTVKGGLNKTEALFYLIRNSFAHGGFKTSKCKGITYYVFENRQGDQIKGRAVIRESSLLDWISIVRKGPDVKEGLRGSSNSALM